MDIRTSLETNYKLPPSFTGMANSISLKFKTLSGERFEIQDVKTTTLVKDIKKTIHEIHGYDPKLQKLIFMGKVLNDDLTLAHFNIKDKSFLVCMHTKPKNQSPPPSSAADEPERHVSHLRTHPDFIALRASFQRDRNITTILDSYQAWDYNCITTIQGNQDAFLEMLREPLTSVEESTLAESPEPSTAIQDMLNQLSPQALAQLTGLSEDRIAQSLPAVSAMLHSMPPELLESVINQVPPALTEQDNSAIKRICELGFSVEACRDAYIACGKDENAAAEFLFMNPPS